MKRTLSDQIKALQKAQKLLTTAEEQGFSKQLYQDLEKALILVK
jgi:hypothetical protein